MIVNVTANHIAVGKRTWCHACPIALALKDATGRIWTVCNYSATRLCSVNSIRLPRAVSRFIEDFDAGIPVSPFSFEFDYEPTPA